MYALRCMRPRLIPRPPKPELARRESRRLPALLRRGMEVCPALTLTVSMVGMGLGMIAAVFCAVSVLAVPMALLAGAL